MGNRRKYVPSKKVLVSECLPVSRMKPSCPVPGAVVTVTLMVPGEQESGREGIGQGEVGGGGGGVTQHEF